MDHFWGFARRLPGFIFKNSISRCNLNFWGAPEATVRLAEIRTFACMPFERLLAVFVEVEDGEGLGQDVLLIFVLLLWFLSLVLVGFQIHLFLVASQGFFCWEDDLNRRASFGRSTSRSTLPETNSKSF